MNTKGFTLVELLAVIVILALLALLTSTAVTKLVSDAKNDLSDTQIELIKSAAESWGAENLMKLPSAGECKYLNLLDLKEYGLLDTNITDPMSNEQISNLLKIKITGTETAGGLVRTEYEVGADVSDCSAAYQKICTAVTSSNASYRKDDKTKTIGNIPTTGTYNIGDEYICEVKPGTKYHFYVLSVENDKINLIMNRNIQQAGIPAEGGPTSIEIGWTPWINETDYNTVGGSSWTNLGYTDMGPISVLKFIEESTSTWEYIPNITMNYTDEGGNYGSIISSGNIVNVEKNGSVIYTFENGLKARLATKEELENVGCNDKTKGSCPLWIFDFLSNQEGYANAGTIMIANYQYWGMASIDYAPGYALVVNQSGYIKGSASAGNANTGIRPVISISKLNLE